MGIFKKNRVSIKKIIQPNNVAKVWMNDSRKDNVYHVGTIEAVQVARGTVTYKIKGVDNWFVGAELL